MVFKREVSDDEISTEEQNEFAQMLNESFDKKQKRVKVGDRVQSEVLTVGKSHVIVSTGTPHDGFVPRQELLDENGEPTVKNGDKIDLFVTYIKGTEIFLSPKASSRHLSDNCEEAFSQNLTVEGKVDEVCNGGFRISIFGKKAFCPISQLDSRRIEKPEDYLGRKFEFKITQYSERGRNIVVSRRALIDGEKAASEATFFEKHKVGSTVSGTVSRLEKFGAFVELAPGLDGLVHISEISHSRVNSASEVLEIGQQVNCTILKIETEGTRKKISLSIKQTLAEPWTQLPAELVEGAVLKGKVTRCLKFGAFVELFAGIEGLVPLSEMSYTKRVAKSDELFKEGELILVKVKEIDAFAKRIALSYKDAEGQDPWANIAEQFKVGSLVTGTVERREAYGLFINIAPGVTGLLPKSKGIESAEFGFDRLKPGESVKVRVAEVRAGERKISLDVPNSANGEEDWKSFNATQAQKPVVENPMGMLGSQLKAAMEKSAKR